MSRSFFLILFLFLQGLLLAAPSSASADADFPQPQAEWKAVEIPIEEEVDAQTLRAAAFGVSPSPGQVLAIRSRSAQIGIIGFAEVKSSRVREDGRVEVTARVLRLSRHSLVRPRDSLVFLDLRGSQPLYMGHTELLVRDRWKDVSARFRPLYIQGFNIGETAQTLGRDEIFVGVIGNFAYGLTDWISISSLLPAFLVDAPNGSMKMRVANMDNDVVSLGFSLTKLRESSTTAFNLTVFWDSITSDKMITHTLATFAVATLENKEDTAAIKTAGTSSLQTGYEVILENWDRVLFGPNYNFETKTIGGYVAYKRIWDQFHLSGSLSSVDVRHLKFDLRTGYVALVEGYWRF